MKLFLILLLSPCGLFGLIPLHGQSLNLQAPHATFDFVDQKNGIGNSCGPAALLNAFGSGSSQWQAAYHKVPGQSDRARIASVIKSWGQAPSETLPNRTRWQRKGGINFTDLAIVANEMRQLQWNLPKIKSELFFAGSEKNSQKVLQQAHKHLRKSLQKGLPPILSVRRFVLRDNQWQSVHGHFVVLTALPNKLAKGSSSFPIEFLDSSGAISHRGEVRMADHSVSLPCLVLDCPASAIGKAQLRKNEAHALGMSGAIGAW